MVSAIKFIQKSYSVNLAETSTVNMQICLSGERYRTIMVLLLNKPIHNAIRRFSCLALYFSGKNA